MPSRYHILVDQAIWGISPGLMPATPELRLEWYREAQRIIERVPLDNSVSWTVDDLKFAVERTHERIEVLEIIIKAKQDAGIEDASDKVHKKGKHG